MQRYTAAVIIVLVTIISYITLPCGGPENLALKTFLQPTALAQSEDTGKSNSTTTIPDSTSIGSDLALREVEDLLQLHNKARAEVGVGPLMWSKNLAIYAQEWADHLASTTCRLEHRPHSDKWKQEYGENLFMGTTGYYSVADAVKAWESEKVYYKRGETLNSSNWNKSGHYTQVVWEKTTHVGCAKVECKGKIIVVCNYDPPGNVFGQKPY